LDWIGSAKTDPNPIKSVVLSHSETIDVAPVLAMGVFACLSLPASEYRNPVVECYCREEEVELMEFGLSLLMASIIGVRTGIGFNAAYTQNVGFIYSILQKCKP